MPLGGEETRWLGRVDLIKHTSLAPADAAYQHIETRIDSCWSPRLPATTPQRPPHPSARQARPSQTRSDRARARSRRLVRRGSGSGSGPVGGSGFGRVKVRQGLLLVVLRLGLSHSHTLSSFPFPPSSYWLNCRHSLPGRALYYGSVLYFSQSGVLIHDQRTEEQTRAIVLLHAAGWRTPPLPPQSPRLGQVAILWLHRRQSRFA